MLFQPIRKNPDARFVPVVLVPDRTEDAAQIMARLRAIAWQQLNFNALLVSPGFAGAYGFLQNSAGHGPGADQLLVDALVSQTEVEAVTDRILVFGFGDGAQFAHRFALRHPRRVAGCAAFAGDSWTGPQGFCTGPMVNAGGFDAPPFDTEAVHRVRKAPCTEPTALPAVQWLVGAPTDAPNHHHAASQFRSDLNRAESTARWLEWEGDPNRVPTPQIAQALGFFNEVVANPTELPPRRAVTTEPSVDTDAHAPVGAEAPHQPGPDDSDAPITHGRVETDAPPIARERAVQAEKPHPKPGDGQGFFDQLLRQQASPSSGE